MNRFLLVCMLLLGPALLRAEEQLVDCSRSTKRVCTCTLAEGSICTITGFYGYETVVELDPNERVDMDSFSSGFPEEWAYSTTHTGSNVFRIKLRNEKGIPHPNPRTNATVVSKSGKMYRFLLVVDSTRGKVNDPRQERNLWVKFRYPSSSTGDMQVGQTRAQKDVRHIAYCLKGSEEIRPWNVWDDGKFTHFRFDLKKGPPPEVLVFENVDGEHKEYVVRGHWEDNVYIVHRLASNFHLTRGGFVMGVKRQQHVQEKCS